MSQPQTYQVGDGPYGQPIYMVNEPGPEVVHALHVNEYGAPAHLVNEYRPGATPVWFANGPPMGSPQWIAQETMRQQQEHAAWAAAQQQSASVAHYPVAQHLLQY